MDAKLRRLIEADRAKERLTKLTAQGIGLTGLGGIETLKHLKQVWLNHNSIADFSALEALPSLIELHLHVNPAKQPPRVGAFPGLSTFSFGLAADKKAFSDLSEFAGHRDLKELRVDNAKIRDLKPIAALKTLADLSLCDNAVASVEPLVACRKLWRVALSGNPIKDLSPLLELPKLRTLYVRNMKLPAAQLEALRDKGVEVITTERQPNARGRVITSKATEALGLAEKRKA